MDNSKIEWTDHTFNPWQGCTKVSQGCKHCYAESISHHFGKVEWGPSAQRVKTSAAYWKQPLKWNRDEWFQCTECGWRGSKDLTMIPDGECYQEDFHYPPELVKDGRRFCPVCLEERAKERQVEPTRQRVFCASMADVFEDNPQVMDWRAELFEMIEATPNLDWLLLTKRPEKIRELGALAVVQPFNHWLVTHKNVWIGTSIETQAEADKRTKALLNVGPCIRFLSAGPLLEEITIPDIKKWDMVIVEGESGPNCRPFEWDWARKIYEECRAYGVMFFMKQGGGHPNKRDKLEDIPYDLRIREFPK